MTGSNDLIRHKPESYRRTLYPTFLLGYHGMWRSWLSVLPLYTGSGNKIVGFYPHGRGNLRENDLRGAFMSFGCGQRVRLTTSRSHYPS
jgi:hypothetical protein